jgi:adenine-specific DNA-methyltransferase
VLYKHYLVGVWGWRLFPEMFINISVQSNSMKKDYSNWSKPELIKEIRKLAKRKKYGLVWDDKKEMVAELCKEKLPLLEEDPIKNINNGDNEPANIMIEGDNYHALSVLNYTHKGKIDVIYIDPPYNTGAKDWKYNNHYVDEEDPYRHSKWIAFMNKRLRLAKNLLTKKGIICVTIDDYELPRLWMLMEEVFGENNFLGTAAIRINPGGRKSKRKLASQHEYALFFSRTNGTKVSQIEKSPEEKTHNYKQDENGGWYEARNLRKEGADSLAKDGAKRYYPIYYDSKTGKLSTIKKYSETILPLDTKGHKRIWRRDKGVIDNMSEEGNLFVKKTRFGLQIYFKFKGGLDGETPKSFWDEKKFSASEHGTQMLNKILGFREAFPFPKSPHATSKCIQVASQKKDAIVLDFFAGSGTTAQAVLELNKNDGGTRKFILCTNNENNIATGVCLPRIKKIMNGYGDVVGLGGNLKYYKTDFVDAEPTDQNKKKLVDKSTEMLCLKEDCFNNVKKGKEFKIFKNNKNKHLGIIYEDEGIEPFKKEAKKLKEKIVVYVFSLDESKREEEFEELLHLVELKPIPLAILNVYKKIFRKMGTKYGI